MINEGIKENINNRIMSVNVNGKVAILTFSKLSPLMAEAIFKLS